MLPGESSFLLPPSSPFSLLPFFGVSYFFLYRDGKVSQRVS